MEAVADIAVVGLGVMGRNLALNLAERGHAVAVLNRSPEKTKALMAGAGGRLGLRPAYAPAELAAMLKRPRALLLMVEAGAAVDALLAELSPLLTPGDVVCDGGNSHFRDSERRGTALAQAGLHYLGLGVSGGAQGARRGPSLMPGGAPEAYARLRPLLESAAAVVEGEPCVAYLGRGAAGHYVKMVHNGIEYALMQLIAEAYDLLRRGLGLAAAQAGAVFAAWGQGPLASYLVETTAAVCAATDPDTGRPLLEMIRDRAGQKGTGQWTSLEALALGEPTPTIDQAVVMRHLSALEAVRAGLAGRLGGPRGLAAPAETLLPRLEGALLAGFAVAFAQGMALLARADHVYGFGLDLATVARVWRGGCIIRAALLGTIMAAHRARPNLANLLLDPELGGLAAARADDLRSVVSAAAGVGLPAPGLMSALAYLDALACGNLPTSLIQAQRDFFGAHGFERVDRPGRFHHPWPADGQAYT
ncbi:MAG: NADP-dependent phosphogluconate dehydrogenase [Thermodesulfobacteriota bacterium]